MSAGRHALVLLALTVAGLGGLAWQLEQAAAADERAGRTDSLPRLVCPLH
jgi:hypothetical protein